MVGSLDMVQATGIRDAERNMSLLLSGQKASRTVTAQGVSKNLPPVATSIQGAVPNQSKEEVSKEVTAVFGIASQSMVDETGEKTKSALIEHGKAMSDFFSKSTEELSKVTIRVNELKEKGLITPLEQAQIDKAEFELKDAKILHDRVQNDPASDYKTEITIDYEMKKAQLAELKKNATLDERESAELAKKQQQQSAMQSIQDPKTYLGRIRALQSNPAAASLFAEKSFGPNEADGFYRALLDPKSEVSQKIEQALREDIDTSPETYRSVLRQQRLTPEQRISQQQAKANAEKELRNTSPLRASQGLISQVTSGTLQDTRVGNGWDILSPAGEYIDTARIESSSSVSDSAKVARDALKRRRADIVSTRSRLGSMTKSDVEKLRAIDASIKRIDEIESDYSTSKPSELGGSGVGTVTTSLPAAPPPTSAPPLVSTGIGTAGVVTATVPAPQDQPAARGMSLNQMSREMSGAEPTTSKVNVTSTLEGAGEFKGAVDAFTRAVGTLGKLLQPGPRPIPSTAAMRAQADMAGNR